MPLYQLFCISTPYAQFAPIRNLITSSASFVRQQGGLVRTVNFRGRKTLVQPMKKFGSNKRTENAGECVALRSEPRRLCLLDVKLMLCWAVFGLCTLMRIHLRCNGLVICFERILEC